MHCLVYGYAADASLEPEWLVITDGQQPGRSRLLHNSSGPEQRCSVGSSLRYQPTPSTREQRSAQDYTFEALHWVYFYDAWRVQPVLDAPESDLVLPPKQGLLEHGCYWPRPNLTPEVLSISDRDPEKEEQEVQEEQSPTSLAVTDAAMAEEDANEAVSIYSSSSESPTIPSTEQPEVLPPQDVDPATSSPTHNPLSPQSNEDRGPRPVRGELSPRSYGNHLLHHPGNHSAAFLNMSNHRPHWQTWPVRMLKIW